MSRDQRRWLIFGASGLVGGHLLAMLGRDRVTPVTHQSEIPGAIRADIADARAVRAAVASARPDVIVIASHAFPERCEREPVATRAINVDGPRAAAEAAPDATLVVFSSEYVFDGTSGPYGEDDAVRPINEYGRQKVDLERVARERPRHLVLRSSGIYGWSAARTSFVAQLVDRLRAGQRFAVPSDQVITPTPAADLARAVVDLVERGAAGTLHAAGPEILPRPELARRAAAAFGLDPGRIDPVPTSALGLLAPRPLGAGLRTERLRDVLGRGLPATVEGLAAMRAAEPR